MARARVVERDAWIALAELCLDLDAPLLDVPADLAVKFGDDWRRRGLKLGLHGTLAGFSIGGLGCEVIWHEHKSGGYMSGGGYWSQGIKSFSCDSWRELVGRITAAREAIELIRRGMPWTWHDKPRATNPLRATVVMRAEYEREEAQGFAHEIEETGKPPEAWAVRHMLGLRVIAEQRGLFHLPRQINERPAATHPVRIDVDVHVE